MILLDEQIVVEYSVNICKTPPNQCPTCPVVKLHDATQYKHRDGMTMKKAFEKVNKTADSAYCLIQKNYDIDNRYNLNVDKK